MTRWYATRSGLNARTDEGRAMAHDQLGPFKDRELARVGLITHLRDGAAAALDARPGSVAHDFGPQYLDLLTSLATHPRDDAWTVAGVRWELRDVPDPEPSRVVQLPVAAPARSEAVVTNVSDLTPAMREGLLDRGGLKGSTRAALVRRGLIKAGSTRDMPELTEAGQRASDELEPPVGARVRHVQHGRVGTVLAIHHGTWSDSVELKWDDFEIATAGSAAFLELAPSEATQESHLDWLEITDAGRAKLAEHLRTGLECATEAERAGSALFAYLQSFVESLES